MTDTKKKKNFGINFPRGNLEEMLRMMRECREKGNIDCETIMKEFMGKEFRSDDYNQIMKEMFREGSKKSNVNKKKSND
ncbi:MAG TPA: hypothetical protein VKA34_12370 [Balneolales bacterium]|jgi:predicted transcriptional regulator|nr:hypothetical protein [Desulfobacteraceae bacterium]MDH3839222.1 hypothetical protein [Desulfobacteraceae bacterium]HKJ32620.1 hypothetical protein [Balneolales bacterium]